MNEHVCPWTIGRSVVCDKTIALYSITRCERVCVCVSAYGERAWQWFRECNASPRHLPQRVIFYFNIFSIHFFRNITRTKTITTKPVRMNHFSFSDENNVRFHNIDRTIIWIIRERARGHRFPPDTDFPSMPKYSSRNVTFTIAVNLRKQFSFDERRKKKKK